jgi:outer membrane lipoprotein-sorting protein
MNESHSLEKVIVKLGGLSVARSAARLGVASLLLSATIGWGQSTSDIFSRLDQAAHSFTSATASIRVTNHTAIIDEDDTQIGTVAVRRNSPTELYFLITLAGQSSQSIAFRGKTLQIYYPRLNTIREYDISKYKDLAQKLILVGFGMAGRELAANYHVTNLGNEHVQSQESVHLQLIPKAPEILKQLSRVDLWVSLRNDCPVQQKFYLPGGDYRLVTYSDVKLNPPLPPSALELPKGAKHERVN